MQYVLIILGAYLLGSSNLAFYLSKRANIDARSQGSGNLGASNAMILIGWKAAIAVGIHDIGKAVLAVLLARWLLDVPYAGEIAGVAAIFGHIFPFYLGFQGGKGFASFVGMMLALNWKLALILIVVLAVVTLVTDYIVLGTLVTTLSYPIVTAFSDLTAALICVIATAVILFMHRKNYLRIMQGTEIGLRAAAKGKHRTAQEESSTP